MLTATYSIVAIAAEQDVARRVLCRLRQYVQNIWHGIQKIDFSFINAAFEKLVEFDDYWHNRKLERYVIPALRKATCEVDPLLAELDALSQTGMHILRTAREQLSAAFELGRTGLHEISVAMETYCDRLLTRLAKEEDELFPVLRRLLSVEEWFTIAAQFLADDADADSRKRYRLSHLRPSASPSVSNRIAG